MDSVQDLARKLRGIVSSVNGALGALESQAETATRGAICTHQALLELEQARSVPEATTEPCDVALESRRHHREADEAIPKADRSS